MPIWTHGRQKPAPESASQRAAHVAALQTERAYLEQTGRSTERLVAIDKELDRFADKPAKRTRETA